MRVNQNKNLNYKIPENKDLLMMDFYLITYLNSMYNEKNILNVNEKIKFSLEEAENLILTYLKDHFLDIVHFVISSEFRHFITISNYKNLTSEDENLLKILSSYENIFSSIDYVEVRHKDSNNIEYLKAYETFKKLNVTKCEFVKLAKFFFENIEWEYQYGGENWRKICDAWLRLFNSKSKVEIVILIDNIYHLQHNTGSIFTKLDSYKINDSTIWIKDSLDFKRDSKSIWDVYENASNNIKPIASFMIKAINEKKISLNSEVSYEDFITNKENNIINSYWSGNAISFFDENWITKKLKFGLHSSNFENFINKYIKEYGEPPLCAYEWAENKLESNTHPKEWEIIIDNFIKKYGYPPGFFYDWVKNKLESGDYPKEWEIIINNYLKEHGCPLNFAYDWMRNKLKSGDYPKEWEITINNLIKKYGYPPDFAYDWAKNKLESNTYPKEWEIIINNFTKEYGCSPNFAKDWEKVNKN